jgi:hypothetical protein
MEKLRGALLQCSLTISLIIHVCSFHVVPCMCLASFDVIALRNVHRLRLQQRLLHVLALCGCPFVAQPQANVQSSCFWIMLWVDILRSNAAQL